MVFEAMVMLSSPVVSAAPIPVFVVLSSATSVMSPLVTTMDAVISSGLCATSETPRSDVIPELLTTRRP